MSEINRTVSPEYRAKCIEWALRTQPGFDLAEAGKIIGGPDAVIEAAKKFYNYVYESGE